jgi:hypothetical protein
VERGRFKPRLKGLPMVGHETRLRGLADTGPTVEARGGGCDRSDGPQAEDLRIILM